MTRVRQIYPGDRVTLREVGLRDGLQQPGLEISVPNAVLLLQHMAKFGVHYAEIGFAGANQFVGDLTSALTSVDTGAMKLALFGRSRPAVVYSNGYAQVAAAAGA